MASANPATVPVGSAAGSRSTVKAVPLVPRLRARSPGRSPRPERRRHVVARARAPTGAPCRRPFPGDGVGAEHLGQRGGPVDVVARPARGGRSGSAPRGVDQYPVPEASPRSVVRRPVSRKVSQSCGSSTAAVRPRTSRARSGRSQCSLVMVKLGRRERSRTPRPTRRGHRRRARPEQCLGVGCGLGVVPELGGPQDVAVVVQDDQAVLLGGDRNGRPARWTSGTPASRTGRRGMRSPSPAGAARCAAGWSGECGGASGRDERAGVGVADLDLARRRGRVDPDHERH